VTCRITKMCRQIFRQYRDDVGIVPYIKKTESAPIRKIPMDKY
jgi:hypothetical protein